MSQLPRDPGARVDVESARHPSGAPTERLEARHRTELLALARRSVTAAARGEGRVTMPTGLAPELERPRGAFVTLEREGALRGCIGHIFPEEKLAAAVVHNARAAALRDPRFDPVAPDELEGLTIEISVLTVPCPLDVPDPEELLRRLRPGVDGVVLELHGRRSTFLPQVWEKLPEPVRFLEHLAHKAGAHPDDWRVPTARVLIYQAEVFSEAEVGEA